MTVCDYYTVTQPESEIRRQERQKVTKEHREEEVILQRQRLLGLLLVIGGVAAAPLVGESLIFSILGAVMILTNTSILY